MSTAFHFDTTVRTPQPAGTPATADLKGVARLAMRERSFGRIARFAGIGIASTLAYVVLFAGLRFAMAAQLANALSLLITAIANTAANRRLTFNVRGRTDALRHQLQGIGVFVAALTVTSTSLAGLRLILPNPGRGAEITVLVLANLCATVLRFVLLSRVFGGSSGRPQKARASRPTAPTTRALLRGIRSLP